VSKQKLFIKLLENGKISTDDAIAKLKCSKSNFYGIVFRLRKEVDIKSENGFYFLNKSVRKRINEKTSSLVPGDSSTIINEIVPHARNEMKNEYKKITTALIANPNISYSKVQTKMSDANFYYFRKKFQRFIKTDFQGVSENQNEISEDNLNILSESDFNDYLEAMKKAVFYSLSCKAILKAYQAVEQLRKNYQNNIIKI